MTKLRGGWPLRHRITAEVREGYLTFERSLDLDWNKHGTGATGDMVVESQFCFGTETANEFAIFSRCLIRGR